MNELSEGIVHLQRGHAALDLGRLKEALREATLAVGHRPQDSSSHALLARTLLALDRPKDSLKAAEAGLAVAPETELLHRIRAHILFALRRRRPALASAREAVRLDPRRFEAHQTLAMALIGMKQLDEAQASAEEAMRLDPQSWFSQALLGDIAIHRRQWAIAEQHYRRSLALEPLHAPVLNALGMALLRQHKEADGLHALRAAVEVDPRESNPKRNFWIAAKHSPDNIGIGSRHVGIFLFIITPLAMGVFGLLLYVNLIFGPLLAIPPLLIWLRRLRRKRHARLQMVESDPELSKLLERVERDSQVRRQ